MSKIFFANEYPMLQHYLLKTLATKMCISQGSPEKQNQHNVWRFTYFNVKYSICHISIYLNISVWNICVCMYVCVYMCVYAHTHIEREILRSWFIFHSKGWQVKYAGQAGRLAILTEVDIAVFNLKALWRQFFPPQRILIFSVKAFNWIDEDYPHYGG